MKFGYGAKPKKNKGKAKGKKAAQQPMQVEKGEVVMQDADEIVLGDGAGGAADAAAAAAAAAAAPGSSTPGVGVGVGDGGGGDGGDDAPASASQRQRRKMELKHQIRVKVAGLKSKRCAISLIAGRVQAGERRDVNSHTSRARAHAATHHHQVEAHQDVGQPRRAARAVGRDAGPDRRGVGAQGRQGQGQGQRRRRRLDRRR